MSVMNGFRQELLGRILGLNGHLGAYAAEGGPLRDFDAVAARIRAVPGIVEATPIIEGQVLITSEAGGASGGLARGIRPADLRERDIIARNILRGSLADFEGEDTIVVGTGLASRLRVGVGRPHHTRLAARQADGGRHPAAAARLSRRRALQRRHERVRQHLRVHAAGSRPGLLPDARRRHPDRGLREDPTRVRAATREILARARRPARPHPRLAGVEQQLLRRVQVERNVMFLILTLIILVAAFNIVTTQTMLVKDKRRDIAILRTSGRPARRVLRVFLMCGAAHRRARHHRRPAARPGVLRLHRGESRQFLNR
jgi:lipoprotein-releasing system permease protein